MALALYKQGPRSYRWLRRFFVLPSPLTLSRMITRAALKPGLNEHLFGQLKSKVDKMNCILLFDEVALAPHFDYSKRRDCITGFVDDGEHRTKKIADHALGFMIRGIYRNYKQPLAYTFCASTTSAMEIVNQLKIIIRKLKSIGLEVLATVCDQGATNVSAINYLINETRRRGYLRKGKEIKNKIFEIDGDIVVPLYDTPHLIKGIRNNLIQADLKANLNGRNVTGKWDHIIELYRKDGTYDGIRLTKLTERHVIPQKNSKMKVKCATQVLSRTVAGYMGSLACDGVLSQECEETAALIKFFDELFDSTNGSFDNFHKEKENCCWAQYRQDLTTKKYGHTLKKFCLQ